MSSTNAIRASAVPVYEFIRSAGPCGAAEISAYLGRDVQGDLNYLQNRGAIRKAGRFSPSQSWRWRV